jgi:hypothetical protein
VAFFIDNVLSHLVRRKKEQSTRDLKSCESGRETSISSQLYFIQCIKEYVDVSALGRIQKPRTREITLVQMSFANCDIWIALPGGRVTFLEAN